MSDGEDTRSLAGLWNRARRFLPGGVGQAPDGWEPADGGAIRPSRTLRPFLEELSATPSPVVVDLGPVIGSNVSFLGSQLACKLYPEDLYADVDQPFPRGDEDGLAPVLAAKLRQAPGEVDGILAWDVFDYLGRGEAAALGKRLASLLRPGGLLMALFTTEPRHEAASRRYVIVDADHLRHRPAPGARWARKVWPLRDIEVLLSPLEVRQSHLLAHRQREMLLRRPTAPGKEG
ncbi:MAG: class I SAM-dependent methyltransferase [Vicinamibacterales bacterium]